MRMHFRPSLASYYKAGAVLGAIFDAALESRYRRHLRPSRSGCRAQGRTSYPKDVSTLLIGSARSEVRCQRTIFRLAGEGQT